MNDRKSFGARIKSGREQQKFTLEKAAELSDVALVTWKQYESGQRLPSISKFIKICLVLQVSAEFLLGSELDKLQENKNKVEQL